LPRAAGQQEIAMHIQTVKTDTSRATEIHSALKGATQDQLVNALGDRDMGVIVFEADATFDAAKKLVQDGSQTFNFDTGCEAERFLGEFREEDFIAHFVSHMIEGGRLAKAMAEFMPIYARDWRKNSAC
jgi:hypothetical protein